MLKDIEKERVILFPNLLLNVNELQIYRSQRSSLQMTLLLQDNIIPSALKIQAL